AAQFTSNRKIPAPWTKKGRRSWKNCAAVVDGSAVHVEPKDPGALDEEGAPLLEERLERSEVEHRRIGFDLPEIGIDRGIEGEVRSEPVLQVGAAGHLL